MLYQHHDMLMWYLCTGIEQLYEHGLPISSIICFMFCDNTLLGCMGCEIEIAPLIILGTTIFSVLRIAFCYWYLTLHSLFWLLVPHPPYWSPNLPVCVGRKWDRFRLALADICNKMIVPLMGCLLFHHLVGWPDSLSDHCSNSYRH